jgi:hypothetical protein
MTSRSISSPVSGSLRTAAVRPHQWRNEGSQARRSSRVDRGSRCSDLVVRVGRSQGRTARAQSDRHDPVVPFPCVVRLVAPRSRPHGIALPDISVRSSRQPERMSHARNRHLSPGLSTRNCVDLPGTGNAFQFVFTAGPRGLTVVGGREWTRQTPRRPPRRRRRYCHPALRQRVGDQTAEPLVAASTGTPARPS